MADPAQVDGDPQAVLPAEGCAAGFEPARNRFVAGAADRLVAMRAFTPLTCSYWLLTASDRARLTRHLQLAGMPTEEAVRRVDVLQRVLAARGGAFERTQGDGQAVAVLDIMRVLDDALSAVLTGDDRTGHGPQEPDGGEGGEPAERPPDRLAAAAFGGVDAIPLADRGGTPEPVEGRPVLGIEADATGTPLAILGGLSSFLGVGWLGILHYDRLRLRPSGLVAGEQVYSLALTPGEEVSYTQRSETRRSRSFEDVLTLSMERELEFSSTWTTGLSQQDVDTTGRTTGGNLSYGVPINVGGVTSTINASTNAANANTSSSTAQATRNQQLTSRITARSREEHKTTFRVGTETVEEFGSKRTVRNVNPSSALTLNFFKLHQKYRVVLERYDAKLGFSFWVDDPGLELRAELEDELAKLDPQVPPDACGSVPQAQDVTEQHAFTNPLRRGKWSDRHTFSTILPAATVLAGWDLEILEMRFSLVGGPTEFVLTGQQFLQAGGTWAFAGQADVPVVGSSGFQRHVVTVSYPDLGDLAHVVSVQARFTWNYGPASGAVDDLRACIAAAKEEIRRSFSMERLLAAVEEVDRGRVDLLFKRLFDRLLPGFYGQGIEPPPALLDVLRNLVDWNEAHVEYLPWWLTAGGRARREALRTRLLALPGDVRSDWVIDDRLIASAARVVLPVKPGVERQAVTLLAQLDPRWVDRLQHCVDDFVDWREKNLGRVGSTSTTYADLLSPASSIGTPAGSVDWDSEWEGPRRRFLVLDEWSELLPTDGVHVEPALSACGSADAFRTSALVSDLDSAAAARDVQHAHAELERALAAAGQATPVVVIGDTTPRTG